MSDCNHKPALCCEVCATQAQTLDRIAVALESIAQALGGQPEPRRKPMPKWAGKSVRHFEHWTHHCQDLGVSAPEPEWLNGSAEASA